MDRVRKSTDENPPRTTGCLPPLTSGKSASSFEAASPEFRAMKIDSVKALRIKTLHESSLRKPELVESEKKTRSRYDSSALSLSQLDSSPPFAGDSCNSFSSDFKPISVQETWENPQIKPIPNYYPLECSNRVLDKDEDYSELDEITSNLSDAFRTLSIQARYLENPAGAALLTPELVEMHLYLWKKGDCQICVEVQRRGGESVTFHRYARYILEAATGDFDIGDYRDYSDSYYLKTAENFLRTEFRKTANELEESLLSIEFIANLLKKDRLDSRILGMESLCILTDPRKTCLNTAMLVCHAIILGSDGDGKHHSFQEIHEFVLNIVQKKCMIDEESLMADMIVDYDSDDEDYFIDDEEERDEVPAEYQNAMRTFVNYGLKILSNAWEVMITFENIHKQPESSHSQFRSIESMVENFRKSSRELTNLEMIETLLKEVGRAETKVHNACLAGKCLKILCASSKSTCIDTQRIYGKEAAIRAELIGKATNARLEKECGELARLLSST